MDVEKLIKQLRSAAKLEAYYNSEYNGLYNQTADALSTLQIELKAMRGAANSYKAENARLRAELEQVKRENNALWTYIEIVDREYRRYMDRGYIDRLDELKKVWKHGQEED